MPTASASSGPANGRARERRHRAVELRRGDCGRSRRREARLRRLRARRADGQRDLLGRQRRGVLEEIGAVEVPADLAVHGLDLVRAGLEQSAAGRSRDRLQRARLEGGALERDRVDRDVGIVRGSRDLGERRLGGRVIAIGQDDQHAPSGARVGECLHAIEEAVVQGRPVVRGDDDLAEGRVDRGGIARQRQGRRYLVAEREHRELVDRPLGGAERPRGGERLRERGALHRARRVDDLDDRGSLVGIRDAQTRDGPTVLGDRERRRALRREARRSLHGDGDERQPRGLDPRDPERLRGGARPGREDRERRKRDDDRPVPHDACRPNEP